MEDGGPCRKRAGNLSGPEGRRGTLQEKGGKSVRSRRKTGDLAGNRGGRILTLKKREGYFRRGML